MRRFAWIAAVVAATVGAGCGGGGGGGGGDTNGLDRGPFYWGVPFVASLSTSNMVVGLRNLDDEPTTATLQGYRPDGTAYPGPVVVDLDGWDEDRFDLVDALGGAAPAGGWILASTPTGFVQVYFSDRLGAKDAEEASRAVALPDLALAYVEWTARANVRVQTTGLQIANATGGPISVTVTPYETADDPEDDPIAGPSTVLALAPFESAFLAPEDLTGASLFVGSLSLTSTAPFFVAGVEDLAYDVPRTGTTDRLLQAGISYGRTPGIFVDEFFDFVLVARNDTDDDESVTIGAISGPGGGAVITSPRTFQVPARGMRMVWSFDPILSDVFGDVFLSAARVDLRFQLLVPAGVDVAFRQYDPVALTYNAAIHPEPSGHVIDVMDVLPSPPQSGVPSEPFLPQNVATILNPSNATILVTVEALVLQPEGVDGTTQTLTTLSVPPRGRVDFSPDGFFYVDVDGFVSPAIGLRFRSNAAFAVTGVRARFYANGIVRSLSPLVVRSFDDAE